MTKILSGEVPAGGILSELPLTKEIGISRTPIREAMGQLAAEGFVEQIPGRGALVKQPSRSDLIELYELREALEVYAVGKVAAQGLTPDAATRLDGLVKQLHSLNTDLKSSGHSCLDTAQMRRFLGLDLHFHHLLLRASGNQRIAKVVRDTRLLLQIFAIPHTGHSLIQLRKIHASHTAILDAVKKGDAPSALRVMSEHIANSKQERLSIYDQWERTRALPEEEDPLQPYFEAV